jgi:hypothetical protein
MASGGPGDHPITDIVFYDIDVVSPRVDALVRELATDRRRELDDLPWYDGVQEQDFYDQIVAIRDHRPLIRVVISWEHPSWEQVPVPPGGWTFRAAALIPAMDERWTMTFAIEPMYPAGGPRFALADFVSGSAPRDAMQPGIGFEVLFAGRVVGRGEVVDRFPFE